MVGGKGREAEFAKKAVYDQLLYAAERIPEIADRVVEVDNAMKWGFNFEVGPFEAWDALGVKESVADMEEMGFKVPKKIKDMLSAKARRFYKEKKGKKLYYDFKKKDYVELEESELVVNLTDLKKDPKRVVDSRKTASIVDIGDGVYCVEFHSVMNALDQARPWIWPKRKERAWSSATRHRGCPGPSRPGPTSR